MNSKHLLAFILTLFASLLSISSASAQVESVLERSRQERLAQRRKWLRLGEWRTTYWGVRSDVDGKDFFLAPNGSHNPEAELEATLMAMLTAWPEGDSGKTHAQCRFPARRAFLWRELKLSEVGYALHPCPEREAWKKRLNADSVSLIFASSYMNNAASMFGHTFLRFHSRENRDGKELLDYGVSFFANTGSDGGIPFALYGLIGAYPGYFSLDPYHETLREYVNLEGRDIFEYRLALNEQEVDALIDHLLELEQTYFDYYFLDENCSYRLLTAIETVRPEINLSDRFLYSVIPADAVRALTSVPGLVQDITYRPALISRFRASAEVLSGQQRAYVRPLARVSDQDLEAVWKPKLQGQSPEEQAQILDAALGYVDTLGAKAPDTYRERAFQLKTWRASLGLKSQPQIPRAPTRPEEGHDPAFLTSGFGNRNGSRFAETQFRFAYHDLMSDAAGYLSYTELEVLRISLRHYGERNRTQLEELNILSLISLQPADEFFRPFAWRASVGVMRLPDRPFTEDLAFSFSAGSGIAMEAIQNTLLLFAFVQGHGDAGGDLENHYRLGASGQIQALARPFSRLQLNAGLEQRFDVLGDTESRSSVWGKGSFTLARNLEFRGEWRRAGAQEDTRFLLAAFFLL